MIEQNLISKGRSDNLEKWNRLENHYTRIRFNRPIVNWLIKTDCFNHWLITELLINDWWINYWSIDWLFNLINYWLDWLIDKFRLMTDWYG
jgi:hypothetical protein